MLSLHSNICNKCTSIEQCYEQTESVTTIPQHNSAYERSYYIIRFSTLPTPLNTGRTYSRMRLSSALRPRTIRPCTAHDTQYCCLMYSLGRVYSTYQSWNAKRTLINRSVANISLGRSVHDVSHLETLHGLILCAQTHFPQLLPYRRNDRSGCSGRGSRDLFPS